MRESEQILRDHGIQLDSYTPGRHYALCPECSHRRSTAEHRKAKVLGVTIDHKGVHGGCNHCGWTFGNGRANLTHHVYRDAAGVERFRKVRNAPAASRASGSSGRTARAVGARAPRASTPQSSIASTR
jgi:hypothetical protein